MRKKKNKGRPVSNHRLHEIMKEHRCSRTWAYKLMRREDAMQKGMERATKIGPEELNHLRESGIISD